MTSDPTSIIDAFESRVREIVGERVATVQYREIDYGSGQSEWGRRNFDSVDYGIEIHTESGRIFSIIWEGTSLLGLLFYEGSLDSELKGVQAVWDATETSGWQDYVGCSITKAHVYWGNGETPDGEYLPAPYDISIEFEKQGIVYIQYGEFSEETHSLKKGDNVTVFFDDETARLCHAGPFMSDPIKYR